MCQTDGIKNVAIIRCGDVEPEAPQGSHIAFLAALSLSFLLIPMQAPYFMVLIIHHICQ